QGIITKMLDEGNAFATLKRSMAQLDQTMADFKQIQDEASKSIQDGLDWIDQQNQAAARTDEQRQQTIQGVKDEAVASGRLLAAYRQGDDAYAAAQKNEAILTAQRSLGADATKKELDAIAQYTATLWDNNKALDGAKSDRSYASDVDYLKQAN